MNDGSIPRDQNKATLSYTHLYQMLHPHSDGTCGWSVRNFFQVQSNPEDPVIRDLMSLRSTVHTRISSMCGKRSHLSTTRKYSL